jgi:hypothetical protein
MSKRRALSRHRGMALPMASEGLHFASQAQKARLFDERALPVAAWGPTSGDLQEVGE